MSQNYFGSFILRSVEIRENQSVETETLLFKTKSIKKDIFGGVIENMMTTFSFLVNFTKRF